MIRFCAFCTRPYINPLDCEGDPDEPERSPIVEAHRLGNGTYACRDCLAQVAEYAVIVTDESRPLPPIRITPPWAVGW